MRRRVGQCSRWTTRATLVLGVLALGCVRTQVRNITGPSGQAALFITCGDPGVCYELAGTHCPSGYDLRPSKVDADSVVVTCRRPAVAPSYAAAPAPTAAPPAGYYPPAAPAASTPHYGAIGTEHAPPPAPPPAPAATREQTSEIASPRPIGAGGPDLGY